MILNVVIQKNELAKQKITTLIYSYENKNKTKKEDNNLGDVKMNKHFQVPGLPETRHL